MEIGIDAVDSIDVSFMRQKRNHLLDKMCGSLMQINEA
jgi:hypothetical protein